ncbi:Imm30 family immunity protein [Paenibacillus graminis]|uniref:Imm30 family immunity protein n=1 Tax=Paenibacillus graminis TaxID=189425 RepID=UPI002DB882D0|nr:Imm30 family immunity protein [Paenibacillus graminis]MEC0172208.1 Imm30 family immunity protein [Paenibacillus graminis]
MYPGIAQLYHNRLLRTELECEAFDLALEGLAGDMEDAVIQQIFKVFDDDTEQEEVMFGLVHFVESYQMEMYLTQLLESLPDMLENARNWAIVLNRRILEDDLCRREYADIAAGMTPRIKRSLAFLLEEIKEDNPRLYERKINAILGQLQ